MVFFYNIKLINIPSTIQDSSYRYRMPKMSIQIEGRGGSIRTNITNMPQVAKSLRTQPSYIIKYFGIQLGSEAKIKLQQNKSNKEKKYQYIIMGQFSQSLLLKLLDSFIRQYILCPKCDLPELTLEIKQETKILSICDSCSFNGPMAGNHKLMSYILKNPPSIKCQQIRSLKTFEMDNYQEKTQKDETQPKIIKQQSVQEYNLKQITYQEVLGIVQKLKTFISQNQAQDPDILSAQVLQKLKKYRIPNAYTSFVIFNLFFTKNIAIQVQNKQKLYVYKKLIQRAVGDSSIILTRETLFNLQYLFLQRVKQDKVTKYIPTILHILMQSDLISQNSVKQWLSQQKQQNLHGELFNENRRQRFTQIVYQFMNKLDSNDENDDK